MYLLLVVKKRFSQSFAPDKKLFTKFIFFCLLVVEKVALCDFQTRKNTLIFQIQDTNTNDSILTDLGNALFEMKTALSGSQTGKKES